jgi:hypothetical protein
MDRKGRLRNFPAMTLMSFVLSTQTVQNLRYEKAGTHFCAAPFNYIK